MKFIKKQQPRYSKANVTVLKKEEEQRSAYATGIATGAREFNVSNMHNQLNSALAMNELSSKLGLLLAQQWENKVRLVANDQDLLRSVMQLRKQYNDDDTEPYVKTKDIKRQVEFVYTAQPPIEQLYAGFSTKPVYTPLGQQYIQPDGSAAFIKQPSGELLLQVGDFRPCIELQTTVINDTRAYEAVDENSQQIQYSVSQEYELTNCIKPHVGEDTIGKQILNIQNGNEVGNSEAQNIQKRQIEQFGMENLQNKETIYVCMDNQDWRVKLFWKLIMDFTHTHSLVTVVLRPILVTIEELLNAMFDQARKIKIGWWAPFGWLPVITVWEDVLVYLQIRQYEDQCSIAIFDRKMKLATDRGGMQVQERAAKRQIKFSTKLSPDQQQVLQVLQLGFDNFNSITKFDINYVKKILGHQIIR